MPAATSFDYAVLRLVPRVEREEFINVGVLVHCLQQDFLELGVQLDRARVSAFAPWLDLDELARHLEAWVQIARGGQGAGPIGMLSRKERFHWLTSPKSSILQVSPVHSGLCTDPHAALKRLLSTMVGNL